jgi:hypothetical protein
MMMCRLYDTQASGRHIRPDKSLNMNDAKWDQKCAVGRIVNLRRIGNPPGLWRNIEEERGNRE